MSSQVDSQVIVAGAGPVRFLFLSPAPQSSNLDNTGGAFHRVRLHLSNFAHSDDLSRLRLAKAGISVIVLEKLPALSDAPRAAVYRGPAVLELQRAGILTDVRKRGIQTTDMMWRKIDGSYIGGTDSAKLFPDGHPNQAVCVTLGQYDLSLIILEHAASLPNFKLHFDSSVSAINDGADLVEVTTTSANGEEKKWKSEYLIGCDGGTSSVRKLLDLPFEGFTFDNPVIANNVYFPFKKYGFNNVQFFIHPEHWALICRLNSDDDLWRVSYGEVPGLTDEEYVDPERIDKKFQTLFPGPKPSEYKRIASRAYRMHQRCAPTFRKGRCLLAGDAARVNNPFGGLGLTGGILDGGAVSEALIGVLLDEEPTTLLDRYSTIRRDIFLKYNDKWSQENVKLLYETDPEKAVDHPLFKYFAEVPLEVQREQFTDDHVIRQSLIDEYTNEEKKKFRKEEEKSQLSGFLLGEKKGEDWVRDRAA
ncbi:FAD/NAD(P)-binding domain-containing protein [Atractiella rhizophila]|nr:FAD/NAD(P)-binding domain-containing protein [Atractiella rhizophila]